MKSLQEIEARLTFGAANRLAEYSISVESDNYEKVLKKAASLVKANKDITRFNIDNAIRRLADDEH